MSRRDESRTDLELIAAINAGDVDAFEPLYFRYRDFVVRLARRFTGSDDDALDVMQDTFAYFAGKFPGFRLTAAMTSFLYPVVRNLSIAARRKSAKFRADDASMATLAGDARPDVDRSDLALALAALSDDHREVLLLRFVDDLSLQEIADALDIPVGTVKSRLHHAILQLRQDDRARKFFLP